MSYFSKHTFMFPFQWDYIKNKKKNFYNERTNLNDFNNIFQSLDNGFKLKKFEISGDANKYNEYVYFHPFARKALYYTEDNNLLRYYEIDQADGVYNIEYLEENKGTKTFDTHLLELNLDSICVHVYETGVGVVSFNLTNEKYKNKEDILKINEFGRRLYPQFMTDESRLQAKKSFLPKRISGNIGYLTFEDDFSQYNNPIEENTVFLPPAHLRSVFGYQGKEQIGDIGQKFVFRKEDEMKNTIRIRPITDDRMFFLSWYGNNQLADDFSNVLMNEKQYNPNNTHYIDTLNYWYSIVFGDKSFPTIANIEMQHEHTRQFTYARWLSYGTIFGVTRDAFVCVSSDREKLKKNNAPLIDEHMQTMYYQMAVLCLVQRASVLRFGWEISQITTQVFKGKQKPEKAIRELYENYIRFINQIYFREVTPQIQGIELYTMFQQQMNLEKEAKDLDGEMQELFNYLSVKEQTHLGRIADLFLPITLIAGLLGINTFNNSLFVDKLTSLSFCFECITLGDIVTIAVAIFSIIVFGKYIYKRLKNE